MANRFSVGLRKALADGARDLRQNAAANPLGLMVQRASHALAQSWRGLGAVTRGLFEQKGLPFTFPSWNMGQPIPPLVDYASYAQEGYGRNAIVFSCVDTIASNAPLAPLRVMKRVNGKLEPWPEHKLQQTLDEPNEYQSDSDVQELHHIYLNLNGNNYFIKEWQDGRLQLWQPRPDRMWPVPGKRGMLGYVYTGEDGERIPFLPEEVIHIKRPNPYDRYQGLGLGMPPLAAAALETDLDNNASNMLKQFFKNAAVPFGLLKSKNVLSDPEIKRIRSRLKAQYTGEMGWWEIMILDADADFQQMGLNFEQMEFPALRDMTESRICAVFGVPAVLVGIKVGLEHMTYNNYGEARRDLWQDKIAPDNARLSKGLTRGLRADLGNNAVIAHDYSGVPAMQDDRDAAFERANKMYTSGWGTKNEARAEAGLSPVKGGDGFKPEPSLFPSTQLSAKAHKGNGADGPGAPGDGGPPPAVEPESWEVKAAALHKALDKTARAWEADFLKAAQAQFAEESAQVRALARANKGKAAASVDWDAIRQALLKFLNSNGKKAWAERMTPLIKQLLNEQGEAWANQFGINWNINSPEAQAFIKEYSFKFANALAAETKTQLRELISQAESDGWSITKLTDELKATYSGWGEVRAEMIARSETIRASNAGANEAYRQAGIKKKKWFTAEDERVCPFCGKLHGKTIAVEKNFVELNGTVRAQVEDEQALGHLLLEFKEVAPGHFAWSGVYLELSTDKSVVTMTVDYEAVGYPPLHPNCRCTIVPVVED